jgi:hypothetical protein
MTKSDTIQMVSVPESEAMLGFLIRGGDGRYQWFPSEEAALSAIQSEKT